MQTQQPTKKIAIAVAIDEPVDHHQVCCRGILKYAEAKPDWKVVIDPTLAGVHEQAGVAEYDGVVGRIEAGAMEEARRAGVPIVNHWMNSPVRDVPSVLPDYEMIGRQVAEHLLARGFREVGYITFPTDRSKPSTMAGLRQAVEPHGLALHELDVPFFFESNKKNFTQFLTLIKQWLQTLNPPIGLYIPNASMAQYTINICNELGLGVPNDVGIVVLYSTEMLNNMTTPTLSWIQSDNERVGYLSAQLLDRLMTGKATEPVEPILVPPMELLVQGSSDAFVSENPVVSQAMRYIAEHAKAPIRIEDVASAVHCSKRTLERHFKLAHDRSVGSEIARLRVEMLKRILLDTELPIGKIADDYGFSSTSHFSRYFRKEVGISPRQYRNEKLGQA